MAQHDPQRPELVVLNRCHFPADALGERNGGGGDRLSRGGLIRPDGGWDLLWAMRLFLLGMELVDYFFHRAQHRWSFQWAIHSFHHTDTPLGATTAFRIYWAEPIFKAACLYPLIFMVLKPNAAMLGLYSVTMLWGYVNHFNLRLPLGHFGLWLTGPEYHRIHHASDSALANKNFVQLLPVIDIIFGTYRAPAKHEGPEPGLIGYRQPAGIIDIALWPFRRQSAP